MNVGYILCRYSEKQIAMENDILVGGRAAFEAAADGVFKHYLMKRHYDQLRLKSSLPQVPSGGDKEEEAFEVLPLKEMFGPELTEFYQYAIERHCLQATHVVRYSLESVNNVSMLRWNVIAGAKRGMNTEDIVNKYNFIPGCSVIITDEMLDLFPENLDVVNDCIIRVVLDVECTGESIEEGLLSILGLFDIILL